MKPSVRKWVLLFAVIASVIILDQITKTAVINSISVGETVQPIPALVPYFQLTRAENMGSAFGFLPQFGSVFLIVAVVVVAAMIYYYPRLPDNAWLTQFAIGLIAGGALGNAIDRLQHGLVIDFIHYRIPGLISNVSNIADHGIVFGVLLVVFASWRTEWLGKRAAAQQSDSTDENLPS